MIFELQKLSHCFTNDFCVLSKGRKVYKELILNLTKALGAKNDSLPDILNIIDFEIKLAKVCFIASLSNINCIYMFLSPSFLSS